MTKNLGKNIWRTTMSLGLVAGIFFPFFIVFYFSNSATPVDFSVGLFAATIITGLLVGFITYILVSKVVFSLLYEVIEQITKTGEAVESSFFSVGMSRDFAKKLVIEEQQDPRLQKLVDSYNQLTETLVRTYELDESLDQFAATINAENGVKSLAKVTIEAMQQYLDIRCGAFLVVKKGRLELLAHQCLASPGEFSHNDKVQKLMNVTELTWCKDKFLVKWKDFFTPAAKALMVCPISNNDGLLAVILIAAKPEKKQTQFHIIRQIRPLLTNAIEKSLVYSQLRKAATRDGLTGIYNHHFGMETLHQQFTHSTRTDMPLGVILFDIDHFKQVNDTYGHLIGDKVLVHVATSINEHVREGDTVFRYGGEEFLVVLPGATIEESRSFAERIRRLVKTNITRYGGKSYPVTISLGVAAMPEIKVLNETDLIKKADEALYRAKSEGRNCVIVSEV